MKISYIPLSYFQVQVRKNHTNWRLGGVLGRARGSRIGILSPWRSTLSVGPLEVLGTLFYFVRSRLYRHLVPPKPPIAVGYNPLFLLAHPLG